MSYDHNKMLEHIFIQRCFDIASKNLGVKVGKLSYTKVLFKNTYRGEYFTHYHKLYMGGKLVGSLYGNGIYHDDEVEYLILENTEKVCKLRRVKSKNKKYHKL